MTYIIELSVNLKKNKSLIEIENYINNLVNLYNTISYYSYSETIGANSDIKFNNMIYVLTFDKLNQEKFRKYLKKHNIAKIDSIYNNNNNTLIYKSKQLFN